MIVQLLGTESSPGTFTGVTATTAPPTLATHGAAVRRNAGQNNSQGMRDTDDDATLAVWNTAGTGAQSVTLRMWGYSIRLGKWFPLGVQTSTVDNTQKGTVNNGNAITNPDATLTNFLSHSELFQGYRDYDRLYLQVLAISGTNCAIAAALIRR